MSKISWVISFFLVILVAFPVYSLELGFSPDFTSYFRIRARVFENATFMGATPGEDDDIFFADSRLLVSPMLKVNDRISVRTQLDIFSNFIWGGLTDSLVSTKVFQAGDDPQVPDLGEAAFTRRDLQDSFRGALLTSVTDTFTGNVFSPTEEEDFVQVRSIYIVGRTPIGELWIGRQPFDWGLGLVNNAGGMPDQDLGSIVDRFEFDTTPFALLDKRWEDLLFAFIVDRLGEGRSISNLNEGDGWEYGVVVFYEGSSLALGGYIFSLYQNNFNLSSGLSADISPAVNWSLYFKHKTDVFSFSFELQHLFGEINDLEDPLPELIGSDSIDISAENLLLAGIAEFYPSVDGISVVAVEGGWANGDDASTPDKLEGNGIFFNNAYTIDNLLFKHIIPTIYAIEGSVINSWYLRGWATVKMNERFYFTPQVLFAWVDERNAFSLDTPLPKVDRFLGAEIEGTLTWRIADGFWFDLIGSVVIPGGGLDDLFSQRAFIEGAVPSIEAADPADAPFAFQGRFVVALDSVIKSWTGYSSLLRRAYY